MQLRLTGAGLMSTPTSAFHEYRNSIQPLSLGLLFTQIYDARTRAFPRFVQIITEHHYEFITDTDRLHMGPRYTPGKAERRNTARSTWKRKTQQQ